MNANRLRKKNKVNGLNPTFRNKMNYLMEVNKMGTRCLKSVISVVNYQPFDISTTYLLRINN